MFRDCQDWGHPCDPRAHCCHREIVANRHESHMSIIRIQSLMGLNEANPQPLQGTTRTGSGESLFGVSIVKQRPHAFSLTAHTAFVPQRTSHLVITIQREARRSWPYEPTCCFFQSGELCCGYLRKGYKSGFWITLAGGGSILIWSDCQVASWEWEKEA